MNYRGYLLSLVFTVLGLTATAQESAPIDIGSRLELMIDDYLVEEFMGSAALKLHHPVTREIVIAHDAPWEGGGSNYHTVFQDGELYRMYYRGADFDLADGKLTQGHPQVTCYAESKDGLVWTKPNLGLFEFEDSKDNNIIWMTEPSTHNFAPFKDANPDARDDQRYKALASSANGKGLAAFVSPDGIRWQLLTETPVITEGAFDSQNLAFWDATRGEYRAYYRDFRDGFRDIRTSTSKDFVNWEGGDWLEYSDAPREHLYTNQIQPYPRAPHLFVGLPTRYTDRGDAGIWDELPEAEHRELRSGVKPRYGTALTDLVLMSSRDGARFHRWNEAFLWPGPERAGSWNYGHLYTACGLVRTAPGIEGTPDEFSIYGTEGGWTAGAKLRRYTMRIDGFASINAKTEGGEMRTVPLTFEGSEIVLNFSTSVVGWIKVVIRDVDHNEIEGFGIDDAIPIFGDSLERKARWKGDPELSKLAGKPVRLRFVLKEADLYSFQFR